MRFPAVALLALAAEFEGLDPANEAKALLKPLDAAAPAGGSPPK